ncbi:MAG: hypothetical protein R2786_08470 [Flavobacteriaceae bacterium]
MKNNILKFVLAFFLVFGMANTQAQDKATEIKKETPKAKNEIEKVKDQKSDFDDKVDAKGGTFTDAASTMKGKPGQEKGNASKENMDEMRKLRLEYSEKLKATKDPKEQAAIKAEMEEKMEKIKKTNPPVAAETVTNTSSDENKGGGTKPMEKPKVTPNVTKGKPTVAMKDEKIATAKEKIEKERNDLAVKKEMLVKANAKIEDARARLAKEKEEGNLTKGDIISKEAKINAAEAKVKRLEAAIKAAETKYDEKESKLSDFSKDQKQ